MPKDKPNSSSAQYLKYSGLAFQMIFVLVGGWLIGSLGDRYFDLSKPYVALTLSLLLLFGLLFKLYRDVMSDSN